jgi:hypothetical protein
MLEKASPEFHLADNLWTKGKGHLFGVLAIEEVSRAYANEHDIEDVERFIFSGRYSASLHLLLGFAAELLTKAAYILHGGNPAFIRKPAIRHDLIALLDAAEEKGFSAPDGHTRAIFKYLREPHQNHQFRYGEQEEVPMPDLVHTIPALQVMSNELQDILEAAA